MTKWCKYIIETYLIQSNFLHYLPPLKGEEVLHSCPLMEEVDGKNLCVHHSVEGEDEEEEHCTDHHEVMVDMAVPAEKGVDYKIVLEVHQNVLHVDHQNLEELEVLQEECLGGFFWELKDDLEEVHCPQELEGACYPLEEEGLVGVAGMEEEDPYQAFRVEEEEEDHPSYPHQDEVV